MLSSYLVAKESDRMDEWTPVEKKKLLDILYKYGAKDYGLIHKYMPEKTVDDIQYFCGLYMEMAMAKWKRSKANQNSEALKNWLTIMKRVKTAQAGYLTDIVPRVLKYISLFEKRSERSCINLNDNYMILSDISSGVASKGMNEFNAYFFYECLLKLAKFSKHSSNGSSLTHIKYLSSLKNLMNTKQSNELKKTENSSVLDPLDLPKKILKIAKFEKNVAMFH